ncbi:MAG: membrane protein insertase YidC [Deltaproteobacteria bacterium]|nr:MAG: membrane protein insertase YidC [Deltaproteobacteria bacterium]
MEKRTILAFILSFIVLIGWSILFAPKGNIPKKKRILTKEIHPKRVQKDIGLEEPRPIFELKGRDVLINAPLYRGKISNIGPSIKDFLLKRYYKTPDKKSGFVDIIPSELKGLYPIVPGFDLIDNAPFIYKEDKKALKISPGSSERNELRFTATTNGLFVTKTFHFYPDSYKVDVTIRVRNLRTSPVKGSFIVKLMSLLPKHKNTRYYSHLGLAAFVQNELRQLKLKKKGQKEIFSGDIKWFACESRYFMSAIITNMSEGTLEVKRFGSNILAGYYKGKAVTIPPSKEVQHKFVLYLGPKEIPSLKKIGYHLDKIINFGWTDVIARPLLYVLRFFYRYVHNYGLAIILLTILVKILFWPLTHKSYESMKEMQKIQPLMAKLREKYKDDKERLNREMLNLYRTYKVNPFSGCLPIIVQIPVFFALYRVLCDAIELRHAPFILWINDLSAPDRLFHLPFSIPLMSPPYGIPVLTLLMGATMYIQQKMTPQPGDPSQAKMMMFLPLVFTVMFINFPSGLVLYWLVNNILSIIQQYRIQKRLS